MVFYSAQFHRKLATGERKLEARHPKANDREFEQYFLHCSKIFEEAAAPALNNAPIHAEAIIAIADDLYQHLPAFRRHLHITRHAKFKTDPTYGHMLSVALLAGNFADYIGLPAEDVKEIILAGILHDIGKIMLPPDILNKPARLDERERQVMQNHTLLGIQLIEGCGIASEVVHDACKHHHERLDGSGYPDGLAGDAISFKSRIITICDVYDALTSVRPYKNAWTHINTMINIFEEPEKYDRMIAIEFGICLDYYR